MKARRRLVLVFVIVACGCWQEATDYQSPSFPSPSGGYSVYATVNQSDPGSHDYAEVVIHLVDANAQEVAFKATGVGDASKWALGWMPDSDVIVLPNSDIGLRAYEVVDGALKEVANLSSSIVTRADEVMAE